MRKRSRYRPKPVGRPVMKTMRDDLILPAHLAVSTIATSADAEAVESARHSLAATFNYVWLACKQASRPEAPTIKEGLQALQAIVDRHERAGTYRGTGLELQAMRSAVNACDQALPYLNTAQLTQSILTVDRALFGALAA